MNRRNFILNTGLTALSFPLTHNFLGIRSKIFIRNKLSGFLIPTLIDKSIDSQFASFTNNDNPSNTFNKSIDIINNKYNPDYSLYYKYKVKPFVGKKELNGRGYMEDVDIIRDKLNDEDKRAISPIHSVRDVKNFDAYEWKTYCDVANLQILSDESLIVMAMDDRPEQFRKEPYSVKKEQAYLVYNPLYYCIGLPIEDPQLKYVNQSFRDEVKNKIGKSPKVRSYYTQRFYYHGANCQQQGGQQRTIYWDYDDAISEFFGLVSIDPCGDPSVHCSDGTDKEVTRGRRDRDD